MDLGCRATHCGAGSGTVRAVFGTNGLSLSKVLLLPPPFIDAPPPAAIVGAGQAACFLVNLNMMILVF
jgi:hypothetical protein